MFLEQLKQAYLDILSDRAVLITILGGLLFYAVLYPQPYRNDLPRSQALAVIDHDRTSASRQLSRWIDAAPGVDVVARPDSLHAARQLLSNGEVHGLIIIPRNFMRDTLLGRSPVVSMAGDANYFLVYGTLIEGAAEALQASLSQLPGSSLPIELNLRPLFNSSMGYLGYVIPAVFVLILQQTLLLAAGLVGAAFNERLPGQTIRCSAASLVTARFTAMGSIYLFAGLFYLGFMYQRYGISRMASATELATMLLAFVSASTALGVFFGTLLERREWAAPIVMLSSLPLIFLAGFVWPIESMPPVLRTLGLLSPSTMGIQGFLGLNQMGASFEGVAGHWTGLFALTAMYLVAAWGCLRRQLSGPKVLLSPKATR